VGPALATTLPAIATRLDMTALWGDRFVSGRAEHYLMQLMQAAVIKISGNGFAYLEGSHHSFFHSRNGHTERLRQYP
jgi:hypothetical protein